MPFRTVLPHDTQVQIDDFVSSHCYTLDDQKRVGDEIWAAIERIAANPTIGAPFFGAPKDKRRTFEFILNVDRGAVNVVMAYSVLTSDAVIVLTGFRNLDDSD